MTFALYLYRGNGRLDFVSLIEAEDRGEALERARAAAPEHQADLCVRPWMEPT